MPIPKGVAFTVCYTAFDFINQVGKTGDAGNHTLRLVRDGVESVPNNSPSEVDATNTPGTYKLNVVASEANANLIVLTGKSSTNGVAIIPVEIVTN